MSGGVRGWPSDLVIKAAQGGDQRAIGVLVEGSHVHVRRFAKALCATPEDAEEAAQEALVTLFGKIGTLRASAALASWMFAIVRNECLRRSRVALHRAPSGAEPSAEEVALAHLELERVVATIAALPVEQRTVLVARDVQGLSGAATARALGLSRAAMKSRLHRARATLRAALGEPTQGAGEGGGAG